MLCAVDSLVGKRAYIEARRVGTRSVPIPSVPPVVPVVIASGPVLPDTDATMSDSQENPSMVAEPGSDPGSEIERLKNEILGLMSQNTDKDNKDE